MAITSISESIQELRLPYLVATPVVPEVKTFTEPTAAGGRTLTFALEAEDQMKPIGEGNHEQVIANIERFEKRARKETNR